MEKNREKAWDQNYVTERKWWTWLVHNVDLVCTNRVLVRDVVLIPGLLPIFFHSCEIKSGSGLGMRLTGSYIYLSSTSIAIIVSSHIPLPTYHSGGGGDRHMMPLYNGASLSTETSSWAIMQFAISNKLTYSATSELLELIKLHCPAPNSCVRSLYMLKKQFNQQAESECQKFHFCSKCLAELDIKAKCCSQGACKVAWAPIAYYILLPFDKDLQNLYTGRQ